MFLAGYPGSKGLVCGLPSKINSPFFGIFYGVAGIFYGVSWSLTGGALVCTFSGFARSFSKFLAVAGSF